MPNTFAMSPRYIARYVRSHHLRKYPFDVFTALRRRLDWLSRRPTPTVRGRAAQLDARRVASWLDEESVALIVTSPPYLKVVRYGKYNWIRLWLLGQAVEDVDARLRVEATDKRLRLADQLRLPSYCQFMGRVIQQCEKVLAPGGTAVFVIGDVDTPDGEHINLAREVWKHVRADSALRLVDIIDDPIQVGGKVTRIWGSTRGQATKTDRVLVLRKPGARRPRGHFPATIVAKMRTSQTLKAEPRVAAHHAAPR